jgi:hypothetical protein
VAHRVRIRESLEEQTHVPKIGGIESAAEVGGEPLPQVVTKLTQTQPRPKAKAERVAKVKALAYP